MEEIEAQRKQVVNDLLPGLTTLAMLKGMVGRTEPAQEGQSDQPRFDSTSLHHAEDTFSNYRNQLQNIEAQARTIKPPAPARAFHQSYLAAAKSYVNVVDDITRAMMNLDQSIGRRVGQLNRQAAEPLRSADQLLGQLLAKYDLERTFMVGDGASDG
jgi:hypothetical protein